MNKLDNVILLKHSIETGVRRGEAKCKFIQRQRLRYSTNTALSLTLCHRTKCSIITDTCLLRLGNDVIVDQSMLRMTSKGR